MRNEKKIVMEDSIILVIFMGSAALCVSVSYAVMFRIMFVEKPVKFKRTNTMRVRSAGDLLDKDFSFRI